MEIEDFGIFKDDSVLVECILKDVVIWFDVFLIIGGVSWGEEDYMFGVFD